MAEKPRLISGVVRGPKGRPIADARVSFTESPVPMADIAALTDERGGFSLAATASGTYRLQFAADGFEPAVAAIEIPAKQEVEIRLKPERGRKT